MTAPATIAGIDLDELASMIAIAALQSIVSGADWCDAVHEREQMLKALESNSLAVQP